MKKRQKISIPKKIEIFFHANWTSKRFTNLLFNEHNAR